MNTNNSFHLTDYMQQCRQRVDGALEAQFSRLQAPAPTLLEAMKYAVLQGGKRIRPLLVYASAKALGVKPEYADAVACAVELIHSYSLVHDDLPAMDDDDLRRGIPTVHKAFNEATAILAGDALQSLAIQVLTDSTDLQVTDGVKIKMINLLTQATGYEGMVGGQSVDFDATGTKLNLEQLEIMHRLKTGALIKSSVQLGALCATQVREEQLAALSAYADCVGLAFQVQDDILDVTADTAVLGKKRGSDQLLNKPTYTSILGLNEAENKARQLASQAIASLESFDDNANPLREIAQYIVRRKH